jgi:hypothetical protein
VVTHNEPTRPYPSVFTFVTDGVASAHAPGFQFDAPARHIMGQ